MPAAKKYKLLKAEGASDGSKPVCAFFKSPDGCRNGDKCAFLHGDPQRHTAEASETASLISSEESDSGEIIQKVITPVKARKDAVEKNSRDSVDKKRKNRSSSNGDDLFANPKEKITKKVKVVSDAPKQKSAKKEPLKKKKETTVQPSTSFRDLMSKLPVASFSIPGVSVQSSTPASTAKKERLDEQPSPAEEKAEEILPKSSAAGKRWIKAIESTRKHERYSTAFDYARHKQMTQEAGIPIEWIKAKPYGAWCASNPQAIAIDLEMCETQDPLTGSKNAKAVCRISVVNAEKPEEVLLDTLVKPTWPVIDYRTRINGIKKEDLDNVEFTLRHAQAFMMALCSEETVITGHAVQNDLVSLFMEHHCIVDSSFLFFSTDESSASLSLKNLVGSIFKKDMPDTHDSVNDARKALECILYWMEKDGDVEKIERVSKHKGNQLFIHRIPKQCKPHHLTDMILKHTSIDPTSIEEIEFSGQTGKCHAVFRSNRHANLAFDTLDSTAEADKTGRLQKKVFLRNGDYVRVRKMTSQNSRNGTPHKTPQKK